MPLMPATASFLIWTCVIVGAALPQPSGSVPASQVRTAFLRALERPRVPLDATVRARSDDGEVLIEEIAFASEAGQRVPTLLFKRRGSTGRQPAVIVLHGTGGSKDGMAARLRVLAARGFVALAIDGRYHGERTGKAADGLPPYQAAILRAYRTGRERPFLFDTVWDVMRLIDYLETRADIDPRRIGVTGISKGGMETYLAAAVDPRIAAAVPLIGVQSFRWALDHGAWDSRAWTLREAIVAAAADTGEGINAGFMRKFYDRVAPGVHTEFDGPAMLPLIAPRPLLVINGDSDPRTPVAGVRASVDAARQAYQAQGVPDRLLLHLQPDTGHQVGAEADRMMLAWFEKWLK
jgi:dienelactone hydrolase